MRPLLLFIFPFILVLNQPNLSTALSFVAMTTVMAYWSGLTIREIFLLASPVISVALTFHQMAWALMFIVLIAIIVVSRINLKVAALLLLVNIIAGYGAIFVWNKVLYEHQRGRIMTFMDPQRDPLGAGYQVLQTKVAIGFGAAAGQGIPERHPDQPELPARGAYGFHLLGVRRSSSASWAASACWASTCSCSTAS